MLWRLLPVKWLVRAAAKRYGIVDPITVLAQVRSFSQPSEVKEPIELLRAGILFQARGLVNTRAIQFNLDWAWPYWVHKQFDPADPSFVPRAYSFTHVNLTQRNWTAVGLPDIPLYPLVDPRGLITPHYDGWSLDFWVLGDDGSLLLPSRITRPNGQWAFSQHCESPGGFDENNQELHVVSQTHSRKEHGPGLTSRAVLRLDGDEPTLHCVASATAPKGGWLAVSLRPCNPEGVRLVEHVAWDEATQGWRVDAEQQVRFDQAPDQTLYSTFAQGDVLHECVRLARGESSRLTEQSGGAASCDVGLATAAALYRIPPEEEARTELRIPLGADLKNEYPHASIQGTTWTQALQGSAVMRVPDPLMQKLFHSAMLTLVQLSAHEIVPGPFNYRRFWFRDAVLMSNALVLLGLGRRVRPHLEHFPSLQKRDGYFRSQEGEWDSNGQVLWLYERYCRFTGEPPTASWLDSLRKGALWIADKRVRNAPDSRHQGLLPAGFSAEHLGPNDFYYWDDYWCLAGLQALSRLEHAHGDENQALQWDVEADSLQTAIETSLDTIPQSQCKGAIPASPYRRMDAGAIGSMVADYPLHLVEANDPRIKKTLDFIMDSCFFNGGFFQDMVHSGVNAYLTCAVAQTLLRQGDTRCEDVFRSLAAMASPTGHWPEAVHPFSGGGCMGDGQHGWAAAEWALLMRNLFVREEGDHLELLAGVPLSWTHGGGAHFGPTLTPYGPVSVSCVRSDDGRVQARIEAAWRNSPPVLDIALPGHERQRIARPQAVETPILEPLDAPH